MREWNDLINEDERAVDSLKGGMKRGAAAVVDIDEQDLVDIPDAWHKGKLDKVCALHLSQSGCGH